ncbi:LAETG motif-containing sortase-dependent surface protein [Streptomyces sp. JNUCC 64]
MKRKTRARQRSGVLVAGAAVGFALVVAPAVAHNPVWSVTCSDVTVELTDYADGEGAVNTVTVTADGEDLLPAKKFGKSFSERLELPEHGTEIEVRLIVRAGDGKEFDVDETKTAPVCPSSSPSPSDGPEPSESGVPSGSATPSEAPTPTLSAGPSDPETTAPPSSATPTKPEPSRTTATAAPAPGTSAPDEDLAETGGSSATPVIAGAAALVLLAGAGILFAVRKRRSAKD